MARFQVQAFTGSGFGFGIYDTVNGAWCLDSNRMFRKFAFQSAAERLCASMNRTA